MTGRDLATILLKILGILWLYSGAIRGLEFLLGSRDPAGMDSFTTGLGLMLLLTAIAGILFIVAGRSIASVLVRQSEPLQISVTAGELFAMFAGIAGLYFAVTGLSQALGLGYIAINRPEWDQQPGFEGIWENQRLLLVTATFQSVLGIALVLRRRGLLALWERVHPMPSTTPPESA